MTKASRPAGPEHVIVWKEEGKFGGWPANRGIWSWGNEILVGFHTGFLKIGAEGHPLDSNRPTQELLGRSTDGGQTWTIERFEPQELGPEGLGEEGITFNHPDFAMTIRGESLSFSYDRGRHWRGPVKLPTFGIKELQSRTDYIVDGPRQCTAFLTAVKSDGKEGRPLCARTTDGGRNWTMLSWIGPEPEGYAIMPASLRLSPTRLISIIRHQDPGPAGKGLPGRGWFPVYVSDDNGQNWTFLSNAADIPSGASNPPSLLKLPDGRLCLAYGYRSHPCGIRARLSGDEGKTWGREIILRRDAGNWDMGYARSVLRPDGKVVTVYYYNDHAETERYIAATIWDPNCAPPETSLVAPDSVRLPAGAKTYRLEVRTDIAAECRFARKPGTPFSRMQGRFCETGGTRHVAELTGLKDGSVTYFYIKAAAADGSQGWHEARVTVAVVDPADPPFYAQLAPADARATAPMTLSSAEPAAPAGYLSTSANDQGAADFTFSLPRKATVIVWGWVFGRSWHEDSFLVAMDDGPTDHYDFAEDGWLDKWHWCAVNGRDKRYPQALNPRTFALEAGEHTLRFLGRENLARLGGVIITDDPYFVPDGPQATIPTKPRH